MSAETDSPPWMKNLRWVMGLPLPLVLFGAGIIGVLVLIVVIPTMTKHDTGPSPTASADGYLFCFWNVENLFDDREDSHLHGVDDKFDKEFARDENLRNTKLGNLSKVLVSMNGGKGPDILAIAEIESDRAAELLQDRLNKDLPKDAVPYTHRLFKEQKQGRHIAPAILTRLPVQGNRTQQIGEHHHRILEGHIDVEGKELVVIASHWKSRLVSKGSHTSDAEGRAKYADVLYGRYKAMVLSNPAVDLLICGDFNDNPDDESVIKHLRATAERQGLTGADEPKLFNLAAGKDRDVFGTLSYRNKWNLFDQIVVSPGLLDDKGWKCLPDTFATERKQSANSHGHPWGFEENQAGRHTKDTSERGFSDHFPVTVRLKVRAD